MGWMIPLLIAPRRRRMGGDEPCEGGWWALPLILVSLVVLAVALVLFLGTEVPAGAIALIIAGIVVLLALLVLLASVLR